MASIEIRHHTNGPDTYRVRWWEDGKQQRPEVDSHADAIVLCALVESLGNRWPDTTALRLRGLHELARKRDDRERTAALVGVTLVDWCTRYVESEPRCSAATRAKYLRNIANHLAPYFGDMPLSTVTGRDIQRWQEWLMSDAYAYGHGRGEQSKRGVKAGTVVDTRAGILSPALAAAARPDLDGNPPLLPHNPILAVPNAKGDSIRPEVWEQEELDALLDMAWNIGEPEGALLTTLAGTGARWSEVAALARPALYPSRGVVEVRRRAVRDEHARWQIIPATKTPDGWRNVSLPSVVMSLLSGRSQGPDGLLLTNSRGSMWIYESFLRGPFEKLRTAMIQRGMTRHLTLHGLRHTAAVRMAESGVDIYTISANLGHKPGTTAKLYGKYTRHGHGAAARALGTLVRGPAA